MAAAKTTKKTAPKAAVKDLRVKKSDADKVKGGFIGRTSDY